MSQEIFSQLMKEAQEHVASKQNVKAPTRKTKDQASDEIKTLIQKSEEAATSVVMTKTNTNKREDKMKRTPTPKVIYRHVPVKNVTVKGIRVHWAIKGEQNVALLKNDEFEIPGSNIWATTAINGIVTPIIMEIDDPEVRAEVLADAMERIRANTKEKYGETKLLFAKAVDSRAILYMGHKKDVVKILKTDPTWKTPISKVTLPTFSQEMFELESSNIEVFKFRVVDPKLNHSGINVQDGFAFLNKVRFHYWTYVSEKAASRGKKPELLVLLNAQVRMLGTISKYCISLNTFGTEAEDFCIENGLELGECNGAIDIECLKGIVDNGKPKYKHGDILEVPIKDFRVVNFSSPDGSSRCGVQLTCTNIEAATALLEEARPIHGELGLAEKGRLFKAACLGHAEGYAELILDATKTFKDDAYKIKTLWYAIPKNADRKVVHYDDPSAIFHVPQYKTQFNMNNGYLWSYIQNHLYKTKTSNTNHYFGPHPNLMLDRLEEEYRKEHGVVVNYAIAPVENKRSDEETPKFLEQINIFRYHAIGRSPMQYEGALQEVLYLRMDTDGNLITDPERIRNKEGKLVTIGGQVTVSFGLISCLQGDYDGDIATEVFSNVAQFPMWRPDNAPNIWEKAAEEDAKEYKYVNDADAYLEAQKRDYKNMIWVQVAIGMFDNFARLLITCRNESTDKKVNINGVERVGKRIPISIGKDISDKREETIKAKKHDIDIDHIQNVMEDFTRRYAPNGVLPKGDKRPISFLLLHNALGLPVMESSERMMIRFIKLIRRINNEKKIHDLDCYKTLWSSLEGVNIYKCEDDSQYWRTAIYKLWANSNLFEGKRLSETTRAKIEHAAWYITGGKELNTGYSFTEYQKEEWVRSGKSPDTFDPNKSDADYDDYLEVRFFMEMLMEVKFSGYRFWSGWLVGESDDVKREEMFRALYDRVETARKLFLDKETGDDADKRDFYSKYLLLAMGNISFGTGFNRETTEKFSLAGYAFWRMPIEDHAWLVNKVHPNNPYVNKYLADKAEVERIKAEREARKRAKEEKANSK